MAAYTLNVFTNISDPRVDRIPIISTVENYLSTFGYAGIHEINVFVDPRPFKRYLDEYKAHVRAKLADPVDVKIFETRGLAHGYVRSIALCQTKYAFQLEHDWIFEKNNIKHSIADILQLIEDNNVHHLRFNKHTNAVNNWDYQLTPRVLNDIPVCATPHRSNNPHIIDIAAYREKYIHLINIAADGSEGVEGMLWDLPHNYIYGGLDHPATIKHVDGRSTLRTMRSVLGKGLTHWLIKRNIVGPLLRLATP